MERLQTLEDITEIARLKAAYCEAVDGGWDRRTHRGEEVAALFVDDGVWDAGKVAPVRTLTGHDGVVWSVAYSMDGRFIVSGSLDNTVKQRRDPRIRHAGGNHFAVIFGWSSEPNSGPFSLSLSPYLSL